MIALARRDFETHTTARSETESTVVNMRWSVIALSVFFLLPVDAELKLKSSVIGKGGDFPTDNRGDEDNVSPPLSWTGVPKNTQSFVLVADSELASGGKGKAGTHWLLYDIPKEVVELREELSGAGASDVARLGMKEDAGQAPVVREPSPSLVQLGRRMPHRVILAISRTVVLGPTDPAIKLNLCPCLPRPGLPLG